MKFLPSRVLASAGLAMVAACSGSTPAKPTPDAAIGDPHAPTFCGRGQDVLGVTPPDGFCVKYFAQVGEARSLSVAPNGDVFVGAPGRATPGGATGGPGAIMVLSDDNGDGIAEGSLFAGGLSDVHAVVVADGFVYFTTQDDVFRTPYAPGQRVESQGARQSLGLPASFGMGGRWTHGLARSVGGQLITSRGEYGQCGMAQGGDISTIGAGGALTLIAGGFRNPMYLRCHPTDEVCAANELGEDLAPGAREKLIMLRPGTTYGYPCCHTKALATSSNTAMVDCGGVTVEDASFLLQDTPFGLDWERGLWPAPFQGALFVALHGSAYSTPQWKGARVVYAPTDPQTRAPVGPWKDFLGGFGPSTEPDDTPLDRPTDVAFSPDGRLFLADDAGGRVFWIAPTTLAAPATQ